MADSGSVDSIDYNQDYSTTYSVDELQMLESCICVPALCFEQCNKCIELKKIKAVYINDRCIFNCPIAKCIVL